MVQVVLEAIEVRCPKGAVCREPVVELDERLRPDAVQAALRVSTHIDEPGVPEHTEMLGHRRLADAEVVDELADRPLAVAKQIENRQPARLGENLKCCEGGHGSSMLIWLYARQVINGYAPGVKGLRYRVRNYAALAVKEHLRSQIEEAGSAAELTPNEIELVRFTADRADRLQELAGRSARR